MASAQFEQAARDVVRVGTVERPDLETGTDPATSGGAPLGFASLPVPDLVGSVIDLKLAEISYKANAKVFEVAARLEDEALDILI